MRIALVSLNQFWENKDANFQTCARYVSEAKNHAVDFIIFPEMTLTGFSMRSAQLAERLDNSMTLDFFKKLAQTHSITIQFGMSTVENNYYYNCSVTINSKGTIVSNYKKMHPFSFSGENGHYSSGEELSYFELQGVKFGCTICYDLRFPEIYSALSNKSKVVINIASWPKKRIDHWRKLIMARAIENQIYLIGVNRTGTDGNLIEYEESSMIVDPSGVPLAAVYKETPLSIYDINFNIGEAYRSAFPTFQDRRPDLYRKFI